jgi:hypothetical protein
LISRLEKPVTILNVFFREQSTVPKVRKELYGSTDLFGMRRRCIIE